MEKWSRLVGATNQMGSARGPMLGRKWGAEEVREAGLVMSEAKGGGYVG